MGAVASLPQNKRAPGSGAPDFGRAGLQDQLPTLAGAAPALPAMALPPAGPLYTGIGGSSIWGTLPALTDPRFTPGVLVAVPALADPRLAPDFILVVPSSLWALAVWIDLCLVAIALPSARDMRP